MRRKMKITSNSYPILIATRKW